jgi:hypothetical protein
MYSTLGSRNIGFDLRRDVLLVDRIDFCSNMERHIYGLGDFDRPVDAFSGENRPKKAR